MSDITCRGSYALGTACGKCSRCKDEIIRMQENGTAIPEITKNSAFITLDKEAELKKANTELVKALREAADYVEIYHDNDLPGYYRVAKEYRAIADKYEIK